MQWMRKWHRDENVFIVGEDVGQRGGVFRATVGLFDKYGKSGLLIRL